nr:gamma-glutamylcyclotransferase family protein [uncultured Chryseobacterium sp.]
MPYLFSYGTLQKEQVQLETFGRILQGEKDTLTGYKLDKVEITDPEVLRKSGQKFHPVLRFSGNDLDKVEGVLFEVTEEEILQADDYEVDDYKRIETIFASHKKGFIYVGNTID